MSAVAFDTLKLARHLRDQAKMPQEQAEGIAHALAEAMAGAEVATKADLALLATKADITALKTDILALKTDIAESKADLLKSVIGLVVAAVTINSAVVLGAMFGLAKLLGH